MRRLWVPAIGLALALTGPCRCGEQAAIMAGTAKVDITPPVGGRMWGYDGRGVSTGVHDPLYARVVVLSSAETKVAIVSWDVCEFQSPRLRRQVQEKGIPHLLLASTHTHGGPDLYQKDFPSKEKPWLRTVEERVLGAILDADSRMFPAYISAAEGEIQLGYNRIRRERNGLGTTWFENPERIPFGPVDPTVGVIRIKDDQGKVRAVLVPYACHPVVLGPKNTLISADYPGPMTDDVERALGNGAVCLFIQGGGGDINPLFLARGTDTEENFAMVRKMGLLLAEEVRKTLGWMDRGPGKSEQLRAMSGAATVPHRWEPDKKLTLGVASLLINSEIGIVSLPGEPFHWFQRDLRARSELPHTYLFGYTDNSFQDWPDYYLPDIQSAAHAGYGASDATNAGLGAGEQLVNLGLIQLYSMRGMFRDKPWRPPAH
jgi:hypothetical protein